MAPDARHLDVKGLKPPADLAADRAIADNQHLGAREILAAEAMGRPAPLRLHFDQTHEVLDQSQHAHHHEFGHGRGREPGAIGEEQPPFLHPL